MKNGVTYFDEDTWLPEEDQKKHVTSFIDAYDNEKHHILEEVKNGIKQINPDLSDDEVDRIAQNTKLDTKHYVKYKDGNQYFSTKNDGLTADQIENTYRIVRRQQKGFLTLEDNEKSLWKIWGNKHSLEDFKLEKEKILVLPKELEGKIDDNIMREFLRKKWKT